MGRRDVLAANVMFTAMQQLAKNGGQMDFATLREKVERYAQLDMWDMTTLPHGKTRWCSALERYSHEYVKAQLITKDHGRWSITAEGIKALKGDALTAYDIARRAYDNWRKQNRI
ncbi:MAG: winged helix-turn-helix domain-containing protein [Syntrophales bacterium]